MMMMVFRSCRYAAIAVFFIVALVLGGCSNKDIDNLPEVVMIDRVNPYHIVRDGDSVGSIAEKYSMTRAELIAINNLTPPYQLYNGQRLIIKVRVDRMPEVSTTDDIVVKEVPHQEPREEGGQYLEVPEIKNEETLPSQEAKREGGETMVEDTAITTEYIWPISGGKERISKKFSDSEDGEIIIQASAGTLVRSISDGVVKLAKHLDGEASSYGNTIIILHGKQNKLSVYSHLKEFSVKEGERIRKGTVIGKVGKTGNAKVPQLCLQVYEINRQTKSRRVIDPELILP